MKQAAFGFGTALIPCVIFGLFPTPTWWLLPLLGAIGGPWLNTVGGARPSVGSIALMVLGGAVAGGVVYGVKAAIY